jgi:glycosyltransferase involved in cell wall biosynthesis
MKIGLYSPFLADNIGGGERYLLTVAECLLPQHQVDLIVPQLTPGLKEKFNRSFNLKLAGLNFVVGPFNPQSSGLDRAKFTHQYDIFYYMTDASFFISKAKKNIVHFMIPFNRPPNLIQRFKLRYWPIKVANSFFTKNSLEKNWKIKIDYVHWGAVDQHDFKPLPKQNIILNVGRFFSPGNNKHCKRQDFLVKTFKILCDQGLTNWRLILNGPIDHGQDNLRYAKKVAQLAKGYPIILRHQGNFKQLQQDYGRSKIYWHAAGYEVDETINPQAVEHLGLSTAEAMSAGAVPIVINKGGQPEIVETGINGLLWNDQLDLLKQTLAIINDQKLFHKLQLQAQLRAKDFSPTKFCQQTDKIFNL